MTSKNIILGGRELSYQHVVCRRQSIGISVSAAKGLTVRAPSRVSIETIEHTLHRREKWILAHLDALPSARIFEDGSALPYCGGRIVLRLLPALGGRGRIWQKEEHLILHIPFELWGEERMAFIKKLLAQWYKRQAGRLLPPRAAFYAAKLGISCPQIKISPAKSCWGNCNGRLIRLSWRLMLLPPELIDYVAAHEVCHLQRLDHSPQFWALLAAVMPAAGNLRQRLKNIDREYLFD